MRRALVVGLAVLALAAVAVGVLVTVVDSGPEEFTEADAEAAVRSALERCGIP